MVYVIGLSLFIMMSATGPASHKVSPWQARTDERGQSWWAQPTLPTVGALILHGRERRYHIR